MAERQASLLTDSQREYLKEGGDGAAARMARKRIRERVHEGLFDFPLLVSGLSEKDRRGVFEDHALDVLPSAFAFLYLGVTETVEPTDLAKDTFKSMVEDGVKEAYRQQDRPVTVDVSIEITPVDSDQPHEDMTIRELQRLAEVGEVDKQDFVELVADLLPGEDSDSLSANYDIDESRAEWIADQTLPDEDESDESGIYDPTQEFKD